MGISIKREDTEGLARQLAKLTGESLTDAIHHALERELARLGHGRESAEQVKARLQPFFARIAERGPGDGRSLPQIEAEMYGEHGEPI